MKKVTASTHSSSSRTRGSKTQLPLTAKPCCLRVVCLELSIEDILNRDFLFGAQTAIITCEQKIWTMLQEQTRKGKFVKTNCWTKFKMAQILELL